MGNITELELAVIEQRASYSRSQIAQDCLRLVRIIRDLDLTKPFPIIMARGRGHRIKIPHFTDEVFGECLRVMPRRKKSGTL